MRGSIFLTAVLALLAFVLIAGTTTAHAVTLIDEDFQNPTYVNKTSNPTFAGWVWTEFRRGVGENVDKHV